MSTIIPHYTNAVLGFEFKNNNAKRTDYPRPPCEKLENFAQRTTTLFQKSGADNIILFGLGSGEYAKVLSANLPDCANCVVCETEIATIRKFLAANPEWKEENGQGHILGDTSLWAHLLLLTMIGATSTNTYTVLNPELSKEEKKRYQSLQRLFVAARSHQAINSSYLSHVAVQAPDLSVGVILDPEEPELDTYFSQFPDWIREIIVIWDSTDIPKTDFQCAAPIKHHAHPLKDFADQRNRMLAECQGEWVLYLDGDETFSEDTWSLFTALMLIKNLEACYFPRMTLYPDEQHCKVGFGLWPDLQLRLFRNHERVRFEHSIHEKVVGIEGRVALAIDAPILHYSRLRKSPSDLVKKLKRFDKAGKNRVQHMLNTDYPRLERSRFAEATVIAGALQVLLLEENPS